MSKKNANPKILILTQIHPVNVAAVYDEILATFGQNNEVFSPQIMALLGELSLSEGPEDFKHSYRVLNAAFVKNCKAAVKKMNPLKPWIFIGNCAKKTIKFDHIIGFNGGEDFGSEEIFDHYIAADNAQLADKNMAIDYYATHDAEYFFPTLAHLKLFLTTVGLKGNTNGNPTE